MAWLRVVGIEDEGYTIRHVKPTELILADDQEKAV
jgi:hypothetical protein